MREKPDSGKESNDEQASEGKRRLDLSVPQVAGSAIAAVVAAKLASNLGVYGTILGAGVVSAIATCGGTVFQHFFKRTGEQIRDVTVQAKPKARQVPAQAAAQVPGTFRAAAYTGAVGATGPVTTTWGRPQAADAADETTALPVTDAADPTAVLPVTGAADPTALLPVADHDQDAERTQLLGSVDATQVVPRDDATRVLRVGGPVPVPLPDPGVPTPSEEFTEGTTHRTQIRSWKRPLIAAAVVFGVTMAGITTYELVTDENFSGSGTGTTFSNVFKGNNTPPKDEPSTPPSDPSGQPSDDGTSGSDHQQGDGNATQDPNGTGGQDQNKGTGDGTDSGSGSKEDPDKGTGTDPDKDKDTGSGDDGSKTDPTPTPTPTPTPSSGTGTGTGGDPQQGETPKP
ncbi:hypothetical protein [Streptomyces formicae]|uniref:Uncharacterized protein n=1 Tax=Streptomyces formicae TaxID=1616117 RepID=A0A291QHT3_9ACTN|nr:hypothetical protein [Streptomyces formicae]ATL31003.1 hypothetical protein KY5_5985 [Streptomyces formicae]